MSDEPIDDISRKRKERHERHRDRHREFVNTMESVNDTIEDGANALLDYRDACDRLKRHLVSSLQNGVINIAFQGASEKGIDLGSEIKNEAAGIPSMLRFQAIAMIEHRAEELAMPDLRLLVVPLDGEPPDASHTEVIDRHADDIISVGAAPRIPGILIKIKTELHDLERPALVLIMNDDMLHEFFYSTEDAE